MATAVKIYPAVWFPLFWRRARSRIGAAVAFVVACAVLTLPWFLLAPGGVGFSFWTQAKRHLQIESLGSTVLLVGSKLGIHHVDWIAAGPARSTSAGVCPMRSACSRRCSRSRSSCSCFSPYSRGPDTDRRLVTAAAAAVVAFTVFGKVLSPQYMTWLLPVVPLAAGRRGLAAGCTFFAAVALTWPSTRSATTASATRTGASGSCSSVTPSSSRPSCCCTCSSASGSRRPEYDPAMPTSVVTGGAGFLGSHLCDYLLEHGHRVICVDNLETGSLENIEHLRDEASRS